MKILLVNQNNIYPQKQNVNFSAVIAKPKHFEVFEQLKCTSLLDRLSEIGLFSEQTRLRLVKSVYEIRGLKSIFPPAVQDMAKQQTWVRQIFLSKEETKKINAAMRAASKEICAEIQKCGGWKNGSNTTWIVSDRLLDVATSKVRALWDLAQKLIKDAEPAEKIVSPFEKQLAKADGDYAKKLAKISTGLQKAMNGN